MPGGEGRAMAERSRIIVRPEARAIGRDKDQRAVVAQRLPDTAQEGRASGEFETMDNKYDVEREIVERKVIRTC